jgi:hypothetical protein
MESTESQNHDEQAQIYRTEKPTKHQRDKNTNNTKWTNPIHKQNFLQVTLKTSLKTQRR